jgi:hypothetical protein
MRLLVPAYSPAAAGEQTTQANPLACLGAGRHVGTSLHLAVQAATPFRIPYSCAACAISLK